MPDRLIFLEAQELTEPAAMKRPRPAARSQSKTRVNAAAKYKSAGRPRLYGNILRHFSIIDHDQAKTGFRAY
jgi:hypothetical protein